MIRSFIEKKNIEFQSDVSLKRYNTYRLEVISDYVVWPKDVEELIEVLTFVRSKGYKYVVLGNGSNVIFKNDRYDGIVILLTKLNKLEVEGRKITVQAGYMLMKLARETVDLGLKGLEFACGIPGAVGASVAMNAGAYGSCLADVIKSVKVLTADLKVEEFLVSELDFSYRDSWFKHNKNCICLEVTMELEVGSREELEEMVKERMQKRLSSQPLEYPSAGSVFRNPVDTSAGELIDKCGLKGYNLNGIEVSTKHANFIVNKNNGRGRDIVKVIDMIKSKVKEKYNIDLVLEQEIIE